MSDTPNGRSAGGKRTVVEEGTEFRGTLSANCPVVILGKVEGELTGPTVEVSDTGVLSGRAKVTELRSRGELAGDLEADEVELAGRVRDKTIIRARSLHVSPGQADGEPKIVFGECELQIGEAPSKQGAISEALAAAKRGEPAVAAAVAAAVIALPPVIAPPPAAFAEAAPAAPPPEAAAASPAGPEAADASAAGAQAGKRGRKPTGERHDDV
jgi:cytoskeletal protein CcmA (bactofilin family)